MTTLALDWATAIEASPPELVRLAAANGIGIINCPVLASLSPGRTQWDIIADTAMRRETRQVCEVEGVRIDVIEAFFIRPETDVKGFQKALESGAWLGSEQVNIVTQDENSARLLDQCGRFCELAAGFGLRILIEYSPRMSQRTLSEAVDFIGKLGRSDVRVQVDSLHTFRSHVPLEVLAGFDSRTIGRVQLCDGPAEIAPEQARHEAVLERMVPGEGEFPLVDFLDSIPDDVVVGLEVPIQSLRDQGVSAADRVKRVVSGSRSVLSKRSARSTVSRKRP